MQIVRAEVDVHRLQEKVMLAINSTDNTVCSSDNRSAGLAVE